MRNVSGVLTLDHSDMWEGEEDMSSGVACCGLGASLTRQRMALARRWMFATSCRTELGQRWRGRVFREAAGAVRWGNMDAAVFIASPQIDWRRLARSRMRAVVDCDISLRSCGEVSIGGESRESRSERAMSLSSVVTGCEYTATRAFHSWRECFGIGYWNIGTRSGCMSGGEISCVVKSGMCSRSKTLWWSRNAEGIVSESPICLDTWRGSQIARSSMHDDWSGIWRGWNVRDVGPVNLLKGIDDMCVDFGEVSSQMPCKSPPSMRIW